MTEDSDHPVADSDARGWEALAALPVDRGNPAPQVRAWFQFQDDCAALVLLGHLGDEELAGVIVERATDLILVPKAGAPELVSIKHREANRGGTAAWTWSALEKDRVLADLYGKWLLYDKRATLAFWSNTGFAGPTHELWRVCAKGDPPSAELLGRVGRQLGVAPSETQAFLAALHLPEEPLPRRKEMEDVAVRRTADVLRPLRDGADATAAACFDALRARVREAATDTAGRTTERAAVAATLAEAARQREALRIRHEFISRAEVLDLLLRVHDQTVQRPGSAERASWAPDPLFAGRDDKLAALVRALRPGDQQEVAPVLLHGMPGAGKTSLAVQFAALHDTELRPVMISGTSRSSVRRALARLRRSAVAGDGTEEADEGESPVREALPHDPSLLLIVDGVTDAAVVAGLFPSRAWCRVVITSTARHIEHGFNAIELTVWSAAESAAFIRTALPDSSTAEVRALGEALGNHPLAVSQAVNYCLASGRPIAEFLGQLDRQPAVALGRGTSAGHPTGLLAAINLQVQLLRQQDPVAGDLLMLMAHLAPVAIEEELLRTAEVTALVRTPFLHELPVSTWARWRAFIARRSVVKGRVYAEATARAHSFTSALQDPAVGEAAVDALVHRSLVRRTGTTLALHPLIATVLHNSEPDPLSWLELGLGLYLERMDPNDLYSSVAELDADMEHIAALVLAALDHQHFGPAVAVAAMVLSLHLATRGGIPPLDSIEAGADFAVRALALVDSLEEQGLLDVRILVDYRRATGVLLQRAGRVDDAVDQLRKVQSVAARVGAFLSPGRGRSFSALLDLGALAANTGRRDLAQEVLDALDPAAVDDPERSPDVRASAAHIRAGLLRLLGQIDEAAQVNATALAAASTDDQVAPRLLADLHATAALLARDQHDGVARLQHELAVLDYFPARPGKPVSLRRIEALISSADAALELLKLDQAVELLTEAEPVTRLTVGVDSVQYAKYLHVRGHLNTLRSRRIDALDDLESAALVFRQAGETARGMLPSTLLLIGQNAALLSEPERANSAFTEAIAIDTALYGPDHPETLADLEVQRSTPEWVRIHHEVTRWPLRSGDGFAAGPRYEPMSGRVEIGEGVHGSVTTWQLHRPGRGVRHGLVYGPSRSGRSSVLRTIAQRASETQLFTLIPTAWAWSGRDRKTSARHPQAAEGPAGVLDRLALLDERLATAGQEPFEPSSDRPAVLVTIDDADRLFRESHELVALVERFAVDGPAAGIAVVLVTKDTSPGAFGHSAALREAILSGSQRDQARYVT
ncbi:hypothetical protein ACQP2F_32860 [Actinoplanes sp. CA-030573]|uniref:hypothetical protein n=1 Tax=Actinoplanes sp. CA-030573 TaxID=3239898 RepID=UPI003D93C021